MNPKLRLLTGIFFITILYSCDIDHCKYDACDNRRITVKVADRVKGRVTLVENGDNDIWVIASEEGIIGQDGPIFDGPDIVIPCNLPDSFKQVNLKVIFSGELKEVCDDLNHSPSFGKRYYSSLIDLRKR